MVSSRSVNEPLLYLDGGRPEPGHVEPDGDVGADGAVRLDSGDLVQEVLLRVHAALKTK